MKKLFILSLLLIITAASFAQKPSAEAIRKRFSLSTTLFNDFWMKVPDSISPRKINQGVDVYVTYNFPMDRAGHMFFFVGAGIGAHNFYSQALLGTGKYNVYNKQLPDATANPNESYFYNAPAGISIKKSKLSITYVDIPFGFQYKATNKVHATLGFKVGWALNDHTKYKGTDLEGSGRTVKTKSASLPNIQSMHYGPFATVGYKWIGLTACYQISSVFQKDLGPQIYPISVGITLRPF